MWAKAVRYTLFLISTLLFLGVLLDLSDPVVLHPGLINYRFRVRSTGRISTYSVVDSPALSSADISRLLKIISPVAGWTNTVGI
jgi:hypothetical protein